MLICRDRSVLITNWSTCFETAFTLLKQLNRCLVTFGYMLLSWQAFLYNWRSWGCFEYSIGDTSDSCRMSPKCVRKLGSGHIFDWFPQSCRKFWGKTKNCRKFWGKPIISKIFGILSLNIGGFPQCHKILRFLCHFPKIFYCGFSNIRILGSPLLSQVACNYTMMRTFPFLMGLSC